MMRRNLNGHRQKIATSPLLWSLNRLSPVWPRRLIGVLEFGLLWGDADCIDAAIRAVRRRGGRSLGRPRHMPIGANAV